MFEFEFPSEPGLVERVYEALEGAGAPFFGVLEWGCPAGMSLAEIVAWNQAKLTAGFRLGFTQNVSQDYRQILLRLPPFTEARVFILLRGSGVAFHLIVPEEEVNAVSAVVLEELALALWQTVRPRSIQTVGEDDGTASHEDLARGAIPAAWLFAFVAHTCRADPDHVDVQEMPGGLRLTSRRLRTML